MIKRILAGAFGFWGPEIILYAVTHHETKGRVLTVLPPLNLLIVDFILFRISHREVNGRPSTAIFMLAGLWLFGTTAIMIGMTFLGAGLRNMGPFGALFSAVMGLIPIYTFIAATYDGSLVALVVVTIIMPILHLIFERDHWIIPPSRRRSAAN